MIYFSGTDLLPSYPTPPYRCIDDIIISLWVEYLEIEFNSPYDEVVTFQRLKVIDELVGYWERKQYEIYLYELSKG
tara:strand:- start:3828 stop:4055 length:228 start_codon:yes stop_codon:yes gene_type:complete